MRKLTPGFDPRLPLATVKPGLRTGFPPLAQLPSGSGDPTELRREYALPPARLPVRATLWSEFGLTVFERAERTGR